MRLQLNRCVVFEIGKQYYLNKYYLFIYTSVKINFKLFVSRIAFGTKLPFKRHIDYNFRFKTNEMNPTCPTGGTCP